MEGSGRLRPGWRDHRNRGQGQSRNKADNPPEAEMKKDQKTDLLPLAQNANGKVKVEHLPERSWATQEKLTEKKQAHKLASPQSLTWSRWGKVAQLWNMKKPLLFRSSKPKKRKRWKSHTPFRCHPFYRLAQGLFNSLEDCPCIWLCYLLFHLSADTRTTCKLVVSVQ